MLLVLVADFARGGTLSGRRINGGLKFAIPDGLHGQYPGFSPLLHISFFLPAVRTVVRTYTDGPIENY